jgi:hypothetical protein
MAVDELAESLGSLEKPSLSLGKTYLDISHDELETGMTPSRFGSESF